jgi:predicted flap endonuclease-1-like 5' DNA nuclease
MRQRIQRKTPMWDVMLRRWLDLLFWWVPRKEGTPRRAEQPARARAPEAAARPAESRDRTGPKQAAQQSAQTGGGGPRAAESGTRPAPRPGRAAEASAPRAAEASARPAATKPAAVQPEKTVAPPVPDDLTVIKGIGPAVQNKLRALGISTFADLAAADPDELMKQLKGSQPLSRGRVRHWTEAARQRARA